MNKVCLVGRLTRDVEIKLVKNNIAVALFTVAVQRKYKDKGTGEYGTDFIQCKALGKTAEFVSNYFVKGMMIGIEGQIETSRYEKDGSTVFSTMVFVNAVEFVEKKTQYEVKEQKNIGELNKIQESVADELPFA